MEMSVNLGIYFFRTEVSNNSQFLSKLKSLHAMKKGFDTAFISLRWLGIVPSGEADKNMKPACSCVLTPWPACCRQVPHNFVLPEGEILVSSGAKSISGGTPENLGYTNTCNKFYYACHKRNIAILYNGGCLQSCLKNSLVSRSPFTIRSIQFVGEGEVGCCQAKIQFVM